jgi:hypothetical protein
MTQQPTKPTQSTQQTKQAVKQVLTNSLAKQPAPASTNAWASLLQNPQQVGNMVAQAKTKTGQPAAASSSSAKGLTTVTLTSTQYQTYQQWTDWAKKYDVDVAAIFSGSPTFETFTGFMAKLKDIRESPSLGSSEKTLAADVTKAVSEYLALHGVSGGSATWGGDASTATLPEAKETKKQPAQAEDADQAPWAEKKFTWQTTSDILKHRKDLLEDKEGHPMTVEELVAYVDDHAEEFQRKVAQKWHLRLGGLMTRTYGGQPDVKWWSIIVEVMGPSKGRIFHYGPEHLYKG